MQPCSCMPLFSFPLTHWPSINDEMEAPGSPCLCSNNNILVFAPKSCYSGGAPQGGHAGSSSQDTPGCNSLDDTGPSKAGLPARTPQNCTMLSGRSSRNRCFDGKVVWYSFLGCVSQICLIGALKLNADKITDARMTRLQVIEAGASSHSRCNATAFCSRERRCWLRRRMLSCKSCRQDHPSNPAKATTDEQPPFIKTPVFSDPDSVRNDKKKGPGGYRSHSCAVLIHPLLPTAFPRGYFRDLKTTFPDASRLPQPVKENMT